MNQCFKIELNYNICTQTVHQQKYCLSLGAVGSCSAAARENRSSGVWGEVREGWRNEVILPLYVYSLSEALQRQDMFHSVKTH